MAFVAPVNVACDYKDQLFSFQFTVTGNNLKYPFSLKAFVVT